MTTKNIFLLIIITSATTFSTFTMDKSHEKSSKEKRLLHTNTMSSQLAHHKKQHPVIRPKFTLEEISRCCLINALAAVAIGILYMRIYDAPYNSTVVM